MLALKDKISILTIMLGADGGSGPAWATRFTANEGLNADNGEVVGIYRKEGAGGDSIINDEFDQ